jgi:GT2 family glycosyltransferase
MILTLLGFLSVCGGWFLVRFSILATDYQPVVSDDVLQRFFDSLNAQSFKDFEVIVYHDGGLVRERVVNTYDLNVRFFNSDERANCWGHNLRSRMIDLSSGDFILHTNTDNVYFPDALETLSSYIREYSDYSVFIMGVKLMGMNSFTNPYGQMMVWYDNPRNYDVYLTLKGTPKCGAIDMMQLVASRRVWDVIGGWYRTEEDSDGLLYEEIASLYDIVMIDKLIGEHY